MQATSTSDTKEKLDKILNELSPFLSNLYCRWLDEREYEDIEDYGKAIERTLSDDLSFIKMTKRPWGFQAYIRSCFASEDKKVKVAFTVNCKYVSYKVIR